MRKEKQMCMNMVTEWPLSVVSGAVNHCNHLWEGGRDGGGE